MKGEHHAAYKSTHFFPKKTLRTKSLQLPLKLKHFGECGGVGGEGFES